MKKMLAILFITMLISPVAVIAEEMQELPNGGRPPIIPTIFSNKESACSIEEPCDNVQEEVKQEKIKVDKKIKKAKKVKVKEEKQKIKKQKVEKTRVKEEKVKKEWKVPEFFKFELETSGKTEKIDVVRFLNLSEAQVQAAKQNRKEGEEQLKPFKDEIKIREKKIKDIEFYNVPSDARDKQVERYYREINNINKEADAVRKVNQENFEKLLTPDQLEKFRQLINPKNYTIEAEQNNL